MKALTNLSRKQTIDVDPLTLEAESVPPERSKAEHAKWRSDAATEWVFLSGFEGSGPDQRIDANNPAARQTAFIADYDQNITKEMVVAAVKGKNCRHRPTLVHPTPSNGVRLIWLFETPVGISPHLSAAWLKLLAEQLKVNKLLPGLDPCWENPAQYYEWRPDWTDLRGPAIPAPILEGWRVQLAEKASVKDADVAIPMEVVATEVEKRWPGRWQGEFRLGARGVRFWDDSASNETAAVVRETGMTCYTGDTAFASWSTIFGKAWVEQFQTNRIGNAVQEVYFVGSGYVFKEGEEWHELRIEAARRRLATRGLSLTPAKGEEQSEVDKVISSVELQNYLHGYAPVVFRRERVVRLEDGRRVFNTATTQMLTPGDPDGDWSNLRSYFEEVFYTEVQVNVWHAWMQRFARRAWEQDATKLGHAIILLGDVNDGKTYLAEDVVGGMFGGVADPKTMLEGETHFNANLFERGVWTNSDGLTVERREARTRYTNMLKAYTANVRHAVHAKGLKSLDGIPWGGRIIITGNLQAGSMNLVPDEADHADDKFLLLRSHGRRSKWIESIHIQQEGPHYLAWLLHRFESGLPEDRRFGFKAWHHPELLARARVVTNTSAFQEALLMLASEGTEIPREVTATQLLATMRGAGALDSGISPDRIGRDLSRLRDLRPDVVKVRKVQGVSKWTLDLAKLAEVGASRVEK